MIILVAEDERISRRSLQRALERWGHEVTAVEDGQAAWELFQQKEFDLIITDWDMPVMDGRELVERIRVSPSASYTYVIMLTGRAEKTDVVLGMEAGADDFLVKPFDRNELRARVNAGQRIVDLERELAIQNDILTSINNRMKHDLDSAAEMQQNLLPTKDINSNAAHFTWYFEPCDELGGDILNVIALDDRYFAMYLLDVTGHGVPAALLSVSISRLLNTLDSDSSLIVGEKIQGQFLNIRTPSEVAERLNKAFPMASQCNRFFTLAYAVFDSQTHLLQYTLAGHPPPVLMRAGAAPQLLQGNGFPIGVVDEPQYEESFIQLQPGDRLLFYSDGITEASNQTSAMLTPAGLIKLLSNKKSPQPSNPLADCVNDVKLWAGSNDFDDDISLLELKIPNK